MRKELATVYSIQHFAVAYSMIFVTQQI